MVKPKVLLLGASLESDNKGVNALGIGAITLLINNYKEATISLLCVGNQPHNTKTIKVGNKTHEVKVYYFSKTKFLTSFIDALIYRLLPKSSTLRSDISKVLASSDIIFDINEGDSFSDIYGLKRIIRHFTDSKLALTWSKPLVFLPQTIGPFNTTIGKYLGKHIIRRLTKVYVRDEKAFPFLKKLKINKELSIDMAVYMEPKGTQIQVKPNTVGININGLMFLNRYKTMSGKYDSYPAFLVTVISLLIQKGYEVLLIPHTYNKDKPNSEDDLEAIKKFMAANPSFSKKVSFVEGQYNAQELKGIISQTAFFMGSRMHSCIAALSMSIPTIGLSYSYKFEGTFKMFDQKERVISLSDINKQDIQIIINQIFTALSAKEKISKELKKINQREMLKITIGEND